MKKIKCSVGTGLKGVIRVDGWQSVYSCGYLHGRAAVDFGAHGLHAAVSGLACEENFQLVFKLLAGD